MISIKKYKEIYIKIIIIILIVLIYFAYKNLDYFHQIINILTVSFILAYILKPIKSLLIKTKRIKGTTASLIIIIGIVTTIVVGFFIIIPKVVNEINNVSDVIQNVSLFLDDFKNKSSFKNNAIVDFIYNEVEEKGAIMLQELSDKIINTLLSISEKLIFIAVVPVTTYYFLSDSRYVNKKFYKLVPLSKRNILRKILFDIDKLLARYILGQITLSIIVTVLSFLALTVLNVKFSIGLSLFNGLLNIIPYFGPILGMIPIVFIALLQSPTTGILATIAMIIIQQIEGNIICPKITGNSTNMHPLIIIILLLVGDGIGGFLGMILAVPIGVIIKVVYEDINYYLF